MGSDSRVPRRVQVVSALPLTSVGKVDKARLRALGGEPIMDEVLTPDAVGLRHAEQAHVGSAAAAAQSAPPCVGSRTAGTPALGASIAPPRLEPSPVWRSR
jgi:hypothetical protein